MVMANIAYTMIILLTGTIVSRATLPTWMSAIGGVLPLTHATEAVRAGSRDGRFPRRPGLLCVA